jgi:uncharacterized protein YbbK (DUF523 family)/uncharacterized protein YbgA (DUF1722 family)
MMSKPRVVISACLNGFPYRYDGSPVRDDIVDQLKPKFELISVCPEVGIGLGIPRKTISLISIKDKLEVIQKDTGLNLTLKLRDFSDSFLNQLGEIDGFLLKAKSPSCGVKSAKVFGGPASQIIRKEDGIFTQAVRKHFPYLPVIDEGRLKNSELHWEFMTKVFLHYNFRQSSQSINSLIEFHARAKYLFMSISQKDLKTLGKILARHIKGNFGETLNQYREAFRIIITKPIRKSNLINALNHIFGYVSAQLSTREKAHFLDLMEKYRAGKFEFTTLIELLRSYGLRFQLSYLLDQYLLVPKD